MTQFVIARKDELGPIGSSVNAYSDHESREEAQIELDSWTPELVRRVAGEWVPDNYQSQFIIVPVQFANNDLILIEEPNGNKR